MTRHAGRSARERLRPGSRAARLAARLARNPQIKSRAQARVMRSKAVRALNEDRLSKLSASVNVQGRPAALLLALLPGRFSCLDLTSASLSARERLLALSSVPPMSSRPLSVTTWVERAN